MKQRMEKMQGEVKKVLQAMREEAETRRPGGTDRTLALARIPGRRYADPGRTSVAGAVRRRQAGLRTCLPPPDSCILAFPPASCL